MRSYHLERRSAHRRGWRRSSLLMVGVMVLFALSAAHADVGVRASVDRTRLAVGESLILQITIEGVQNAPVPSVGGVDGFQVNYQGPSTQVSLVNGRMSASVTHRFALVARKQGSFRLGPFTVNAGGKVFRTQPVSVVVVAPAAASRAGPGTRPARNGRPWLVLIPGKESPYVGERIPLTIKLYIGASRVDDLQFPRVEGANFTLGEMPQPMQQSEVLRGRRYKVLRFDTTLTPLRAGHLSVGPPTMGMNLLVARQRGGVFGDFFGNAFAQRRPYEARGETATLDVRPLPVAGRPADFSGAVGHYKFFLEATPRRLNAGDPVTVRMRLSGDGNVAALRVPRLKLDKHFRVYDPLPVKKEQKPDSRVFEQVVIPRDASVHELPPVTFSFFDPTRQEYRSITRGPLPLVVSAARSAATPRVLFAASAEPATVPAEKLGRDIVYIKDTPGHLSQRTAHHHPAGLFAFAQVVPVATFLGLAAWVRRRDRFQADPRLPRFRRAGKEMRRALAELRGADGSEAFSDRLAEALRAYLEAKLDLPSGAVGRERVLGQLSGQRAGKDVANEVGDIFSLLERLRYAPGGGGPNDRKEALRLAVRIVDALERDRGLERRLTATALALALLCGAVATLAATPGKSAGGARRVDVNTAFYEGNSAYKDGRYAEAVAAYERVLAAGKESGALFFNLGNAYFKQGELGHAILQYERARRLLPRDPDVTANLRYARELAGDEAESGSLLRRIVTPLAARATITELAWLTACFWWLFWIFLAARLLRPRARASFARVAVAVGVLVVFLGANLFVRVWHIEFNRAVVVTAGTSVAVRFEPSKDGTRYFEVKEGVVLDVTGQREGWLQVRRRDGRRGWIRADTVTAL